jgi:hypothetical protein
MEAVCEFVDNFITSSNNLSECKTFNTTETERDWISDQERYDYIVKEFEICLGDQILGIENIRNNFPHTLIFDLVISSSEIYKVSVGFKKQKSNYDWIVEIEKIEVVYM